MLIHSETERLNAIINRDAAVFTSNERILEGVIKKWQQSQRLQDQITGVRYYKGRHDILKRKRTAIGTGGRLIEINNVPNNRIVDNQYSKIVDQKANFLLGKPFVWSSKSKRYADALGDIFTQYVFRVLKNICQDSLICGIGWLYVYYDETGNLRFKRFAPYEMCPLWADAEHIRLDAVIRVYERVDNGATVSEVEVYTNNGVTRYALDRGKLAFESTADYIAVRGDAKKSYKWGAIPIIPWKYNSLEIPLINKVKSLQDSINLVLSDFVNAMQEDAGNSIFVLKNYDGENLAEFRHNISTHRAVKVTNVDGSQGGVDILQTKVDAGNYQLMLQHLKKALIENAMAFDAKDDRLSGAPNQMNIQSMYADIELDANGMETEYQASLEHLLYFINMHLKSAGIGDFTGASVTFTFNRDMLMNETDIINNIRFSSGLLSKETLVANHPWINSVQDEMTKIKKQAESEDIYAEAFRS